MIKKNMKGSDLMLLENRHMVDKVIKSENLAIESQLLNSYGISISEAEGYNKVPERYRKDLISYVLRYYEKNNLDEDSLNRTIKIKYYRCHIDFLLQNGDTLENIIKNDGGLGLYKRYYEEKPGVSVYFLNNGSIYSCHTFGLAMR